LDFDRSHGLYSLPVKLGFSNTLQLSFVLHLLFLAMLVAYGWVERLGVFYWVGLGISSVFLGWEHRSIREDFRKINAAFFTANGLLSLFFLACVTAAVYLG